MGKNRKQKSTEAKKQPIQSPPPGLHQAIEMLKRALTFLAINGIKLHWTMHDGSLVIEFRGLALITNPTTGKAAIVTTSDLVDSEIQKTAAKTTKS